MASQLDGPVPEENMINLASYFETLLFHHHRAEIISSIYTYADSNHIT